MNAIVFDFLFFHTTSNDVFICCNKTQNLAKFGSFRPSFLLKIGIAALLLSLNPRHVKKFRECRSTDVGESELTVEKEETCAKLKIAFTERAI